MSWWDDNAPGVTTGQVGLPRDASAVNQNPAFAPSTNIVPGQDIPLGTMTPAPAAAASGPPTGGDLRDPAYAAKVVAYYATQPGANPSLARDPQYWIGKITSGELGTDMNYIIGKFNTPEGAPAGQGGSLGSLGGQNSQGFGGYIAPFTDQFSAPTAAQAAAQPGYEFIRDQALKASDTGAASLGTLLTGGHVRDREQLAAGLASTNYNNLYNQSANTFGINQSTFYHNQDSPYAKLFNLSNLGKPTTP